MCWNSVKCYLQPLSFQNFGDGGPLWSACIPSGEVDFPYWTPDVTVFLFCSANNLISSKNSSIKLSDVQFIETTYVLLSNKPHLLCSNLKILYKKIESHERRIVAYTTPEWFMWKYFTAREELRRGATACHWFVPETSVSDLGHFGNKPQKRFGDRRIKDNSYEVGIVPNNKTAQGLLLILRYTTFSWTLSSQTGKGAGQGALVVFLWPDSWKWPRHGHRWTSFIVYSLSIPRYVCEFLL